MAYGSYLDRIRLAPRTAEYSVANVRLFCRAIKLALDKSRFTHQTGHL